MCVTAASWCSPHPSARVSSDTFSVDADPGPGHVQNWTSRWTSSPAGGSTYARNIAAPGSRDHSYEPKLRTFALLARALGVSMEALLYGEDETVRMAEEREDSG
jgi:hypothetical protein